MPLGGLRSSVVGSLHADSEFPEPDNIRRERISNMAVGDESTTSNQALVASNSSETLPEKPVLGTFNPGTNEVAIIFKLKTKSEHEKRIEMKKENSQLF